MKAQSYSHTSGQTIPDNTGVHVYDTIYVSGLSSATMDTSFGLAQVCFNITHTYDGDLIIRLIAPDGTIVGLSLNAGGGGHDFINTCVDGVSSTNISAGAAPFTGSYRSAQPLGNVNNGQIGNGNWIIDVQDVGSVDTGTLWTWSMDFNSSPARSTIFSSSNLPIVKINTYGAEIPDGTKIEAMMDIIYNGSGLRNRLVDSSSFRHKIGIEIRGSSSTMFPQKGYGFSTWDIANADTNMPILGMPSESDWVLYNPYNDKSILRNVLTYKLSNDMGQYASRSKFCEVVLNNAYVGIYVILEKVKRDNNRVDISKLKLTDNADDSLTGGYIIKTDRSGGGPDYWYSQYKSCLDTSSAAQNTYYVYHYPKLGSITPPQEVYIKAYFDSMEAALADPNFSDTTTGFRKWLDVSTFIDYSLINELTKNIDGYLLSTFYHKDRIDNKGKGKIKAGPVWDHNLSMGNGDYRQGAYTTGWEWEINCETNIQPFIWGRLYEDSAYRQQMKCRYTRLRQDVLSTAYMDHFIDSNAIVLDEAKERHFEVWPILGVYTWPNAYYPPTYGEEIDTLKNWLHARVAWMDFMLYDTTCPLTDPVDTTTINDTTGFLNIQKYNKVLKVFPNPTTDKIMIEFNNNNSTPFNTLEFIELTGKVLYQEQLSKEYLYRKTYSMHELNLTHGFYFVRIKSEVGALIQPLILLE